mmetsp:Transcript_40990/g.94504  ORF Transcript_40990/g.94504 Transcript_40990/m.94504 type:complete len:125 (-) Transcript_40990:1066-1440(-)
MAAQQQQRVVVKIPVLGCSNVGKTSLMKRYCNNSYTDERRATTGADFATKKIVLQDTQMVTTTLVLFHAISMLFPCCSLLWAPVCVGAVSDGDAVCCRGGATTTWGYKSRRRHANTRTRVSDPL